MPPTPRRDLDEVLERSARTVVSGEPVVEYTGEVALHAPIPHPREERVELAPEVEASLRRLLDPGAG